jgi:hypothetical protein
MPRFLATSLGGVPWLRSFRAERILESVMTRLRQPTLPCSRIARRRVLRPVVRVDVALAFQGLRDVPDVDNIPEARRNIELFQSFCLLNGSATIVPY